MMRDKYPKSRGNYYSVNNNKMKFQRKHILIGSVIFIFVIYHIIGIISQIMLPNVVTIDQAVHNKGFTIRVNTFRRNDLLEKFLKHYSTCKNVHSIQVVWSDQETAIPELSSLNINENSKIPIIFEKHSTDSLNNRFISKLPVETDGVLSIDDDLVIACDDIEFAFQSWTTASNTLVGFVPRIISIEKEHYVYNRWIPVWRLGAYHLILTKACFLHSKYLSMYEKDMPRNILKYIDENRNCEDIAMAFMVANITGGIPQLWVKGKIQEIGSTGISSSSNHDQERSNCVDTFVKNFGHFPFSTSTMKLIPAKQSWFW